MRGAPGRGILLCQAGRPSAHACRVDARACGQRAGRADRDRRGRPPFFSRGSRTTHRLGFAEAQGGGWGRRGGQQQ